jgi:hypothetical protein
MDTSIQTPRRIPALLSYLHPFRLVTSDEYPDWNVTIEQINDRSWDYVKLHALVGAIEVGMQNPYNLVVGFDGTLALPPVPELRSPSRAVEFFNRCLASILLGGVYCEAVTLDSLDRGSILDWKYIRAAGTSQSFSGQFHNTIRLCMAAPVHAIHLLAPRTIHISELHSAAARGFELLSRVPRLIPEFLLKGVTGLARHDLGAGVSNLWIVIEQLTAHLWEREIVIQPVAGAISGRQDQLRDNRSWTAATKQELLYQKGCVDWDTLRALFVARKSRNDLFHEGKHPTSEAAQSALDAVRGLLLLATREADIPLFSINLQNHVLSDPFQPPGSAPFDLERLKYWLNFPKLPGEDQLAREEFEAS